MTPTKAAAKSVHELLREWRGEMKLDRAAVYLSDLLGREVSRETIRRYEVAAEAPRTLDPVVLAGLARVYSRDPSDLPPPVVEELRKLASVVATGPDADPATVAAKRLYVKAGILGLAVGRAA
ncbi:MAG: hypothetical protein LC798_16895 [Chloroflexi bacterium]|nr:hypothetical protein [Chloroflexota bacterium]